MIKFKNEKGLNDSFYKYRPTRKEIKVMKFIADNVDDILNIKDLHKKINAEAKMQGKYTIEEVAEHFFKAQDEFSYDECFAFVKDLYLRRSLSGYELEIKYITEKNAEDNGWTFKKASQEFDNEYNVDVIATNGDKKEYIQIKPDSYKYSNRDNYRLNKIKEDKLLKEFGAKVHYVYYNKNKEFNYGN